MRRYRAWMPVGVILVALAVGLIRLGAQPLSLDEQFTRDTATLSWSGIWEAARDTEAPHVVYYALLKPWLAVFGTSEWALRLPSVLFGALAAGATALLGRRLFGELAGLAAGLALAASSYFVSWSQAARGYTLAALLATLATYAFVRACEERSTAWWAIWAVSLAARRVGGQRPAGLDPDAHAAARRSRHVGLGKPQSHRCARGRNRCRAALPRGGSSSGPRSGRATERRGSNSCPRTWTRPTSAGWTRRG